MFGHALEAGSDVLDSWVDCSWEGLCLSCCGTIVLNINDMHSGIHGISLTSIALSPVLGGENVVMSWNVQGPWDNNFDSLREYRVSSFKFFRRSPELDFSSRG